MLCFVLPKWVINRIDKARRTFLWGSSNRNGRGVSLCNWQLVCMPKRYGGLGLPDMHVWNMALVLRWWWNGTRDTESIWHEILIKIRIQSIHSAGPLIWSKRGSFFWCQLVQLRPMFDWSTNWRVGNGTSISYYFDRWGEDTLAALGSRQPYAAISIREANELNPELCSNLIFNDELDILNWNWSSTGLYTAKSFYLVMMTGGRMLCLFHKIWKYAIPPSVRIFMRLLLQCKILTGDVMQRRNFNCQLNCTMCTSGCLETALHLLFLCPYAIGIWHRVSSYPGTEIVQLEDSVQGTWLKSEKIPTTKHARKRWRVFFSCTCWAIWRNRNLRIFEGKRVPMDVVADWVV